MPTHLSLHSPLNYLFMRCTDNKNSLTLELFLFDHNFDIYKTNLLIHKKKMYAGMFNQFQLYIYKILTITY